MSGDGQFQQKLAEIGDRYLRRTQAEIARLHQLLVQARAGDAKALVQMGQIGHKVHGSGAMFGFDAVSDVAGTLERLVDGHRARGEPTTPALLAQCATLIDQLQSATDAAARSRGLL
jgi:chemotaxis protein histidine kinase CheA